MTKKTKPMAKRYDTYKDSGVQWIGEIPGHWGCVPLKRLISIYNGSDYKEVECAEGVPVFGSGGPFTSANVAMYDGEVVMYGRKGTIDKPLYYSGPFWTIDTMFYSVVKTDKLLVKFQYYASTQMPLKQLSTSTALPSMTMGTLGCIHIPLPPLSEQHSIVSYLDDKCAKIDKMLEGKQKQIELLAEMKQRIIADAVTRGLNPDVKMKATNIPWLPEIPEHWGEQRMASLFSGDIEVNKDFEFKKAFKFNYGQLVPKNEIGDPEEYREVYVKYSKIKQGDILVNGLNLNYDFISQRVACAPSEGIITSAYVVCRPREGVNYDYYTFLFKSMDSMKLFHGMGTGIRLTLSFKEMKKQILPIPPKEEQRAIVSYITEKTTRIDTLAAKLQQEIESIKEYKQRLISDVVTGQIKVC